MTAQGGMLFLQFTFTFQIFGKRFPLFGSFIAVILRQLFVDELLRIAVVEVIAYAHLLIVFPRPVVVQNEIEIGS